MTENVEMEGTGKVVVWCQVALHYSLLSSLAADVWPQHSYPICEAGGLVRLRDGEATCPHTSTSGPQGAALHSGVPSDRDASGSPSQPENLSHHMWKVHASVRWFVSYKFSLISLLEEKLRALTFQKGLNIPVQDGKIQEGSQENKYPEEA